MRQFYLIFAFTSLLLTFPGTGVRAQVNLLEDFDGTSTLPYTTDPAAGSFTASDDVWEVVSSVGSINPSATGGSMFWGARDVENAENPNGTFGTLTFTASQICSVTSPTFTFEYNVFEFDGGDDLFYTLVLDGAPQPPVVLIDGNSNLSSNGWETATIPVPEGTINAQLIITIDQNGGGDYAGIDNVAFTGGGTLGGCGTVCGISNFGPAIVTCLTESTDSNVDEFVFEIAYLGSDDDVALLVEAGATTPANDVTATTTIGGDDPTTQVNGLITFTSTAGEFIEGDEVRVTLSDGDNCSFVVEISTTANQCSNPCDINLDPADVRFFCEGFTAGNDGAFAYFPFTGGPEPGFTISVTGGATIDLSQGDPETDPSGFVILRDIVEGGFYQFTVGGGPCPTQTFPVVVPSNICVEPSIVINEVLADPGTTEPFNDTNGNGTSNTDDEFVELFNRTDADVDVSGWTLEDGFGVRYTFPPGSVIPARGSFVIIGDATGNTLSCLTNDPAAVIGLGLSNSGDVVALRQANGFVEHNMSYGPEGNMDQSLALVPDGDLTNGYQLHTNIPNPTGDPLTSSPCLENDDPQFSLPVELLSFTATTTDKTVELAWATANEVANDRFVVERSAAGRQWEQIGTVRAAGRSNGDYGFTDAQPLNGRSLYRLRQIDLDGSFALYGPLVVEFAAGELAVYPNPAGNELRFNQQLEPTTATLFGGSGKVLRQLLVNDGRVDVSALRPGIYLLRVELEGRVETLRFVKQ